MFKSDFRVADDDCDAEGGITHELMHVLGAIHTQTRPDRKNYIKVNKNCIINEEVALFQYKLCEDCETHGVPYKCNSIMHYYDWMFSTGPGCPTMTAADGNLDCPNIGGNEPLEEDWELLRREHCEVPPTM